MAQLSNVKKASVAVVVALVAAAIMSAKNFTPTPAPLLEIRAAFSALASGVVPMWDRNNTPRFEEPTSSLVVRTSKGRAALIPTDILHIRNHLRNKIRLTKLPDHLSTRMAQLSNVKKASVTVVVALVAVAIMSAKNFTPTPAPLLEIEAAFSTLALGRACSDTNCIAPYQKSLKKGNKIRFNQTAGEFEIGKENNSRKQLEHQFDHETSHSRVRKLHLSTRMAQVSNVKKASVTIVVALVAAAIMSAKNFTPTPVPLLEIGAAFSALA
ncbi:hypothetical protein Tco_0631070 [Tanacetum coccineum]